jgi:hypothetical protein
MNLNNNEAITTQPNESKVRGKILDIHPVPTGPGHIWQLHVTSSQKTSRSADFAKHQVGKTIEILIPPDTKHRFSTGDAIEAKVSFQGDEYGGAFFLINDEASLI